MANHILRFRRMLIGVASFPRSIPARIKRLVDFRLFSDPSDLDFEITKEEDVESILDAPSYCNPFPTKKPR